MKTKQQLITELNCMQKRLWHLIEELKTNRNSLGTDALQSVDAHILLVKRLIEKHITT